MQSLDADRAGDPRRRRATSTARSATSPTTSGSTPRRTSTPGEYHWHVHLWPNLVTAGRLRARHRRDDQRHAARDGRRDAARRPHHRRDAGSTSPRTTTPRRPTVWAGRRAGRHATSTGWPTPRSIRFMTDRTAGVGTRFECVTKVGPIRLTDRMEITEWEPGRVDGGAPHRRRHRHRSVHDRTHSTATGGTRFTWEEELTFPWWLGGRLGAAIGGRAVMQPDLGRQPAAAANTGRGAP